MITFTVLSFSSDFFSRHIISRIVHGSITNNGIVPVEAFVLAVNDIIDNTAFLRFSGIPYCLESCFITCIFITIVESIIGIAGRINPRVTTSVINITLTQILVIAIHEVMVQRAAAAKSVVIIPVHTRYK